MVTRIDRPTLNRKTPEENLALVDRWMSDTCDKLNQYILSSERRLRELEERIKDVNS